MPASSSSPVIEDGSDHPVQSDASLGLDAVEAATLRGIHGIDGGELRALLARIGSGAFPTAARLDAFARFEALPWTGATRTKFWNHDLSKIDVRTVEPAALSRELVVDAHPNDATLRMDAAGMALDATAAARFAAHGVRVTSLDRAFAEHPESTADVLGRTLRARAEKFTALAYAFQNGGGFVSIAAGATPADPIVLSYTLSDAPLFPYTLVHVGANAKATVIERTTGGGEGGFLCGVVEFVLEEGAHLTYAIDQRADSRARVIVNRAAEIGENAQLNAASAELGAMHSVGRIRAYEVGSGAHAALAGFFFTNGKQHVDLEFETAHVSGDTTSDTLVKAAGSDRGQGRFVGNIIIPKHANGSNAALKMDALLLSDDANIDTVPALEIASNDVKAFHGATVGALDPDQIFYVMSRGLTQRESERLLTLAFFEPAIARFPESMQQAFRDGVAEKLGTEGTP